MTITPNYLYLEKVFTQDDLKTISELCDNGQHVDGSHSLIGKVANYKLKNNTEIILDTNQAAVINQIMHERMQPHQEFFDFTAAKATSSPIMSRMFEGNYYNPHGDSYHLGDFSTTYFLSDPDTYDGGELCLWINGEEKKFKPPAGSCVTYKTGIPHRVNTVTKGVRNVAVSWTISGIKDPFDFELYYGLSLIKNQLPDNTHSKLENAVDDPRFIARTLLDMILRKHNGA